MGLLSYLTSNFLSGFPNFKLNQKFSYFPCRENTVRNRVFQSNLLLPK